MRDKVFTIRLSEQEHSKMRELAKELSIKPSELIRGFINGELKCVLNEEELDRAVKKSFRSFV